MCFEEKQNYTDTYRKCGNRLNHSSHSDNSWGLPEGQIKRKMVINVIHAYEFIDCYKYYKYMYLYLFFRMKVAEIGLSITGKCTMLI